MPAELAKLPCVTYLDDVGLSDGLLNGHIRKALIVTCSDIGIVVPFVCSNATVPLWVCQNFGHQATEQSTIAFLRDSSIEDAIVYGHSGCQFMKDLTCGQMSSPIKERFAPLQQAFGEIRAAGAGEEKQTIWRQLAQWSVLHELKRLIAEPQIAQRLLQSELKLHAWVYLDVDKQLEVFDPRLQRFVLVKTQLL